MKISELQELLAKIPDPDQCIIECHHKDLFVWRPTVKYSYSEDKRLEDLGWLKEECGSYFCVLDDQRKK